MTYLKKVLLATGLVASTLCMSTAANAGAIIQQDIYADIMTDFDFFGITAGDDQWIGSITYNTDLADPAGFLDTDSTVVDIQLGSVSLSYEDGDGAFFGDPILAGFNPLDFTAGLEFFSEIFIVPDGLDVLIDVGELSSGSLILFDVVTNDESFGDARFGNVAYVPEPSALLLMLAGLGLLARRKMSA